MGRVSTFYMKDTSKHRYTWPQNIVHALYRASGVRTLQFAQTVANLIPYITVSLSATRAFYTFPKLFFSTSFKMYLIMKYIYR